MNNVDEEKIEQIGKQPEGMAESQFNVFIKIVCAVFMVIQFKVVFGL